MQRCRKNGQCFAIEMTAVVRWIRDRQEAEYRELVDYGVAFVKLSNNNLGHLDFDKIKNVMFSLCNS